MSDKISDYFEELKKDVGITTFNPKQWEVLERGARRIFS